ncbi:hypothetical protein [Neisseria shayeganii]|uniref:Uncharacterized protein n=1 Tax=Neisseria shayeganii TaxID=607712 RepID=A0A7D7S408_9NEIS|nr:hypothetical protein [Neisseria shayeganii]QMT39526.1 hypothetical protein H3L94_06470 [Neisseria shayeganii]
MWLYKIFDACKNIPCCSLALPKNLAKRGMVKRLVTFILSDVLQAEKNAADLQRRFGGETVI